MRGKGVEQRNRWVGMGITPAYAGKSAIGDLFRVSKGDHPRVCGEKRVSTVDTLRRLGSPPRMRGKAELSSKNLSYQRITPAYAGKSR